MRETICQSQRFVLLVAVGLVQRDPITRGYRLAVSSTGGR
jgi:hypothetical protein